MKQLPLEQIEQALLPVGTIMFADLIVSLEEDTTVEATRRRDMVSGLRRISKALGRDPRDVPCHAIWLQARLDKISPAALGLSKKTWQNVISDAKSAMVQVGIVNGKISRTTDLNCEWQPLWQQVLDAGDRSLPPCLGRFVHFCNRLKLGPGDVTDDVVASYHAALLSTEIRKSPYEAVRATVSSWNLAARRYPTWPQTTLTFASRRKKFIRPLEDFPASFRQEFEHLFKSFAQVDLLDFDIDLKPLRPYSISQYRRQLQRFASEVVAAGVPIDEMGSLHVLCVPANAELGLRRMLARSENKTTGNISGMSNLLCRVGRSIAVSQTTLNALKKLSDRLAHKAAAGMTQKNRTRLRVLRNDGVQAKLLNWPSLAFWGNKGTNKREALIREDALAILLFLYCPVRRKNLASIHLEHNIRRLGDGRVFLTFDEEETKSARPLEFELPVDVVKMLDAHLAARTPFLCEGANPWLFPRRTGQGHIDPGGLARRIKDRLFKELGLEMNVHLFRHFGAMMVLDSQPGAYELARQLLGHSQVSRTISVYSGLESYTATSMYADIITAKKRAS